MPKSWSEVDQSQQFQGMNILDKNMAQYQYFNEVVAPQLTNPTDTELAKQQFFQQYSYAPKAAQQEYLREYTYSPEQTAKAYDRVMIGQMLNIHPDQIDVSTGGKFLDRVDYSFSDTDQEILNKFAMKYDKGAMFRLQMPEDSFYAKLLGTNSRLIFKYNIEDDKEKWKTVEETALTPTFKDTADLAAPMAEAGVSGLVGAVTGGESLIMQMLAYGGGAAGAHVGKEALEQARGTQLQSAEEIAKEAAMKGATTSAMVLGAGALTKGADILAGRGAINNHPELAYILRNINKAKSAGMKTEELMAHQKIPLNKVWQRLGAQAESMDKGAQTKLIDQKLSAYTALAQEPEETAYKAQKRVLTLAQRAYKKEINDLKNQLGRQTVRQGDRALSQGVKEYVANSKKSIDARYSLVDNAAATENPIFNLTNVKEQANTIKKGILGEAEDITKTVETGILTSEGKPALKTITEPQAPVNIASTPEGKLVGIINKLNQLKPEQFNYEVLKDLRTQTGDLIETWPWEASANKGAAKRLYRELTQAMNKPINRAPNFVRLHTQASSAARARFDFLDAPSIQTQIRNEPTGKLIQQLSKPNALTDTHLALFHQKDYPSVKRMAIKKGILSQILLDEKGSYSALNNYRASDPEAWRFLVPKSEEKGLEKIANNIDRLRKSNLGQLAEKNTSVTNTLDTLLLKPGTTRAEVLNLAKQLGPKGNESLRTAIYEDILNKSSTEIKGIKSIDKKKLELAIKEYKTKGIWDSPILNANDRLKLKGLKSYLDLILYRGSDPGVSLEAAQAITQLKHPATFFQGLYKIKANSVMAKFLSSKMANKLLVGSGKNAFRRDPLIALGIYVNGLAEGTEPGYRFNQLEPLPAVNWKAVNQR